jgi:hypothetical protein
MNNEQQFKSTSSQPHRLKLKGLLSLCTSLIHGCMSYSRSGVLVLVIIMHLRLCIMAHSRVPRGGGCFDANIRTAFTADSIESIYSEIGIDVR